MRSRSAQIETGIQRARLNVFDEAQTGCIATAELCVGVNKECHQGNQDRQAKVDALKHLRSGSCADFSEYLLELFLHEGYLLLVLSSPCSTRRLSSLHYALAGL